MKTKNESRDEECYAKALILSGCPKLSNISAIASAITLSLKILAYLLHALHQQTIYVL